jgi:hypothetical protein
MSLLIFLCGIVVGAILMVLIALFVPLNSRKETIQASMYMDPVRTHWMRRKLSERDLWLRTMPIDEYMAYKRAHNPMASRKVDD